MFSHRPRSCLAVLVNVRLFYHKNKFLPQYIVTWSIQNEITSFQIDSFSQRKNSQQRHWSGVRHRRLCGMGLFYFQETGKRQEVGVSKSALLSLSDNNLSNTEPIATKYSFIESLLNYLFFESKKRWQPCYHDNNRSLILRPVRSTVIV